MVGNNPQKANYVLTLTNVNQRFWSIGEDVCKYLTEAYELNVVLLYTENNRYNPLFVITYYGYHVIS